MLALWIPSTEDVHNANLGELELLERELYPREATAFMEGETITVPGAAQLQVLRGTQTLPPDTLPDLYKIGAELMRTVPQKERAETSLILRAAIMQAEMGSVPPPLSGNRGVALLALEAVANAILCWRINIAGQQLSLRSGKVFTAPGGPGRRVQFHWPFGIKTSSVAAAPLFILLDVPALIVAPSWFLATRELPLPLSRDAVRHCKHAASLALREYLWQMVGWNQPLAPYGKPVGGREIEERLRIVHDEEKRGDDKHKAITPGALVESLHKTVASEFNHIESIALERLPIQIIERTPPILPLSAKFPEK